MHQAEKDKLDVQQACQPTGVHTFSLFAGMNFV